MSSSASSAAYPYAASVTDLPPVPPLPTSGDSIYADMPVTPGGHTNNAAFHLPRAMASTTSFDHSDHGSSPLKPPTRQLRDDDHEDASSGDHAQWGPNQRPRRKPANIVPAPPRPNALAISLGAEGLGQLPAGIGTPDPQAPVEYALNILMSRFITFANAKVKRALDSAQDADPKMLSALSAEEDALFDSVCGSLAHISRKGASSVIRSLFRWKSITVESDIDADLVRRHLAAAPPPGTSSIGTREVATYLARRKELFAIFLASNALFVIAKTLARDSLNEAHAAETEEQTFTMLLTCTREKDKDRTLLRPITHIRDACFESVSKLIGEISRTRFVTISDRFVEILEQSTKAPSSKNVEDLLVAAIQSLRHLKITIYPMELFEEGADFVDVLARHFAHCHGFRIKASFAEAFAYLMLPVAQTASAEVNHPTWTKAVDTIWPRMTAMATKPRYWTVAYPLHVTLLAVSPEEKLAANWFACLEAGVVKLKDRANRPIVLNAAVRLVWAYAFRCHESHTNTHKKLEAFFRIWFPANRRSVHPSDSSPDPFIMMLHYALYRHFDFGRELMLNFLCHSALGGSTLSLQSDVLSGQRMTIAIRAILLTLDAHVRAESPPFPCSADFHHFDFDTLPEGSGDELPEGFKFPKPEIGEAQNQFNDLIGKIALLCDHQISDMTVFDARTHLFARTSHSAGASAAERALLERDGYTCRYHRAATLTAAYPRENQPSADLLRACFESWPRCLSPNISLSSVLGVLFRAHFSADPDLSRASARALRRIASQRPGGSSTVVSGFMRFIFRMDTAFWEIHPKQMLVMPKVEEAVRLWIDFMQIWLAELRSQNNQAEQGKGFEMERTSTWALMDEVEAYALFLLCSASRPLRSLAIEILRLIAVLDDAFSRRAAGDQARAQNEDEEPTRIVHLLDMPCQTFLDANDPHLSWHQINHLARWKSPDRSTSLKVIAESEREVEQSLWFRALPLFLRMSLERFPTTVAVFRSYITNRVLEMDHVAVYAADISNRAPAHTINSSTLSKSQAASAGTASLHNSTSHASLRDAAAASPAGSAEYQLMAQHWRFYVLALCTTTTSTEGSRGGVVGNHRRKTSEPENGERMISARDLFQKLVPFLASDNEAFRMRSSLLSATSTRTTTWLCSRPCKHSMELSRTISGFDRLHARGSSETAGWTDCALPLRTCCSSRLRIWNRWVTWTMRRLLASSTTGSRRRSISSPTAKSARIGSSTVSDASSAPSPSTSLTGSRRGVKQTSNSHSRLGCACSASSATGILTAPSARTVATSSPTCSAQLPISSEMTGPRSVRSRHSTTKRKRFRTRPAVPWLRSARAPSRWWADRLQHRWPARPLRPARCCTGLPASSKRATRRTTTWLGRRCGRSWCTMTRTLPWWTMQWTGASPKATGRSAGRASLSPRLR